MLEGGRIKVCVLPPDVNVVVTLGPVALEEDFEKDEDEPDDELDDEDFDNELVATAVSFFDALWLDEAVRELEDRVLGLEEIPLELEGLLTDETEPEELVPEELDKNGPDDDEDPLLEIDNEMLLDEFWPRVEVLNVEFEEDIVLVLDNEMLLDEFWARVAVLNVVEPLVDIMPEELIELLVSVLVADAETTGKNFVE